MSRKLKICTSFTFLGFIIIEAGSYINYDKSVFKTFIIIQTNN